MEMILLWLFLILGVVLLSKVLRKPPLKNWLLCFFIASYPATFLGGLVVHYHLISYPVQLFPQFQSNVLYEYLLLPLVCTYYYQASYHKGVFSSWWQALVYISVLTVVEILLEKNTDLLHYINWNWYYSLISQFLFLLLVRWLMWLINETVLKREGTSGSDLR